MSRDLPPGTMAAIGQALAGIARQRQDRLPQRAPVMTASDMTASGRDILARHTAAKLRELEAALADLLREEDRMTVDLALIAAGVSLRALAVRLEGAP